MNRTAPSIRLGMAVTIGLNAVIGAGVFTAPAALLCAAGPAGLLTYGIVIAATLCIAFSLARMVMLHPMNSMFYNYPKLWLGHKGGLLATAAYIGGLTTALGLLAFVAGRYANDLVPAIPTAVWLVTFVALLVLLNTAGAGLKKTGQVVLLTLTLLPMIALIGLCSTKASVSNLTPFMPYGWMGIFKAIKIIAFGFFGFEALPSLFSAIKNPRKNVPWAIMLTILITALLYVTFVAMVMLAAPASLFTSSSQPLSSVLNVLFPSQTWIGWTISAAIIITILGTIYSMLWSVSVLTADTIATARGKKPLSQTKILWVIGILTICCGLFLSSKIELLFSLTSIGISIAYALSIVPLLQLSYRRSWGQVLVALGGIAGALLLCICGLQGVLEAWNAH